MERQSVSSLLLRLLFLLLLLVGVGFTDQADQFEEEGLLHRSRRATTPCEPNPCQNGKNCTIVGSSYQCECNSTVSTLSTDNVNKTITTGWTGVNCTEDIDECKAKPCYHMDKGNVCVNRQGTFKCLCDGEKYIGKYCEKTINQCKQPHPTLGYSEADRDANKPLCLNGGSCSQTDTEPRFKCTCVPGYDQVRCQRDIDECAPKPCQNGANCTDLVNNYTCTCVPGFEGRNCETNIDECKLHKPCQNNATCGDKINDYACNCTGTGFQGKNCSVDIDECAPKPCKNGANCTNARNKFICGCHPGYKGLDCGVDIDECSPNPCQYNSTCSQKSDQSLYGKKTIPPFNGNFSYDKAEGFVCECVNGTRGANCSENINDCSPDPCKNGAQCVDKLANYECKCKPGYDGRNCQNDIKECEVYKPCQNNATCKDKVNDYECVCAPMNKDGLVYAGKNCSVELLACRNNECKNGATCKAHLSPVDNRNYSCVCQPGWTKWDCSENTVLSYNGSAKLTISSLNVTSVEVDVRIGADTTGMTMAVMTLNDNLTLGVRDNRVVLNEGSTVGSAIVTDAGWVKMKVADGQVFVGKAGAVATENVAKWIAKGATITKVEIGKEGTFGAINMQPLKGCTRDIRTDTTTFVATQNHLKEGAQQGCTVPANPCKATTCAGPRSRCLNLWNEFRCECELGRYGTNCENKTLLQTFGNAGTSYSVFAASQKLKQRLSDQGKLQLAIQLLTRASKKASQQELLFYFGVSKKTAGANAPKFAMATINDKGQLQVSIAGMTNPLLFPLPELGNGFLHSLVLTLSKAAADLVVNGTKYSPQGSQSSVPDIRAELASADLLCVGGYKGLAAGTTGPGFGLRVRRSTDPNAQVPPAGVTASVGLKAAVGDARAGGDKLALSADDKTPGAQTSLDSANVKKGVVTDKLCPGACQNGATGCVDVPFNSFRCNCTKGWREQDCAFKDYCVTGTDQCPAGFTCRNVYRQDFYECAGALSFPNSTEPITFSVTSGTAPNNLETLAVALTTRATKEAKLLEANDAAGVKVTLSMTASGTVKAKSPGGETESSFKVNTGKVVRVVVVLEGGKAPALQEATTDAAFAATKAGSKAGVPGIKKVVLLPAKAFEGCISGVRANGYPFRLHSSNTKDGGPIKWTPDAAITLSVPHGKCNSAPVCSPNPCKNGRNCTDLWNLYKCECGTEYNGTHCENPLCKGTGGSVKHSACANGGSCVTGATVFTCQCTEGWGGARCAVKDECKSSPCKNSGTCKMNFASKDFLCTCRPEYQGDRCEVRKTKTGSVNYALIFGLIGALLVILLILLIFLIVRHVRASRATSGNYNPHTREMNGSNVYMANVIKPPPGERLI